MTKRGSSLQSLISLFVMALLVLIGSASWVNSGPAAGEIPEMIEANMVEVPGGTFMMEASSNKGKEHGHWVKVDPFMVGRYEVTQREYEAVMAKNPSYFRGDPNLPVEQVSWNDAQQFVKRLNGMVGKDVYRLPTDAEWEYICLSGTNNEYGFSDQVGVFEEEEYAWHAVNSGEGTHPVGQLRPNPWGLYDTHGNVWEWCQDWHGEHPPGTVTTSQGPSLGSFRVLRGGAYDSPTGDCRSHTRRSYSPAKVRTKNVGFRLARTIPAKVILEEAVTDYPFLGEMVDKEGFNSLSGIEQQQLIGMIEKYVSFLLMGERYKKERTPSVSSAYFRKAESMRRVIEAEFGHVLKK